MDERMKKHRIIIAIAALCIMQIVLMGRFGVKKAGYFEDEIYSFMLADCPDTFLIFRDGFMENWQSGSEYRNAMMVRAGETAFHYEIPWENQKNDVLPPLYYFLIHTISSLFPGSYSKWFGIIPNMFFCILTSILLYFLGRRLLRHEALAAAAAFSWGLGVGCMTTAVYIRMYAMLTMLSVLFVLLSMRFYEAVRFQKTKWTHFAALFLVTWTGILTHYYFLILCFFLCGCILILLLIARKWRTAFFYACTELGALSASVAFFPGMLRHFFQSYRGDQAFSSFTSKGLAEYLHELSQNFSKISNQTAAGILGWILIALAAAEFLVLLKRFFLRDRLPSGEKDGSCPSARAPVDSGNERGFALDTVYEIVLIIVIMGVLAMVTRVEPYRATRYLLFILPFCPAVMMFLAERTLEPLIRNRRILIPVVAGCFLVLAAIGDMTREPNYLYSSYTARDVLKDYQDFPAIVVNATDYDLAPSEWTLEYGNYPAVFRCRCNSNYKALKRAAEERDLTGGFLLYAEGYEGMNAQQIFGDISEYLPVRDFALLTGERTPVYFCHPVP